MTTTASLPQDNAPPLDTSDMIACPNCDALYRVPPVADGARARCLRCHTILTAPRRSAMTRIVMLALTSVILMVAAVFFPFLELDAVGHKQRSSLLDVALVFAEGPFLGLAFAVGALVILLPLLRLAALLYVITPMALGWHPARHARAALRLDERIRPWAMSEVFIVGVAVALVKIAGLAHISLGPAFWAFVLLVLINTYKDTFMCRLTLWKTLEQRSAS